jgi:hypothetical protein
VHRQNNRKGAPLIHFALHRDPPAVTFDDAIADGQSHPGAIGSRGEKRLKEPLLLIIADALSRVAERNIDLSFPVAQAGLYG